jgi:hypothetical protein
VELECPSGVCVAAGVPSLSGLDSTETLPRHCRAGLSRSAASRLRCRIRGLGWLDPCLVEISLDRPIGRF